MSVKFGDIDIAKQILENEFFNVCFDIVIKFLQTHNPDMKFPDKDDWVNIRKDALKILQDKYPNSGIKLVKKFGKHEVN